MNNDDYECNKSNFNKIKKESTTRVCQCTLPREKILDSEELNYKLGPAPYMPDQINVYTTNFTRLLSKLNSKIIMNLNMNYILLISSYKILILY